ncbi:hypothetical protein V6N11_051388 [Hibiscus sabdariffa]|uniref:Uncharacterized protein n=1 Tax=Hibiscus sabdariffa TaxID=183260 RepID=A0ABR2U6Y2_9ROSI
MERERRMWERRIGRKPRALPENRSHKREAPTVSTTNSGRSLQEWYGGGLELWLIGGEKRRDRGPIPFSGHTQLLTFVFPLRWSKSSTFTGLEPLKVKP